MPKSPKRPRKKARNRRNPEAGSHSAKEKYVEKCRKRVTRRLRGYPRHAQSELNLHRYSYQEAMTALSSFIRESVAARLKSIRVITGRGEHSRNGVAVLKESVGQRLAKMKENRIVRGYRLEQFSKGGSYMVYL